MTSTRPTCDPNCVQSTTTVLSAHLTHLASGVNYTYAREASSIAGHLGIPLICSSRSPEPTILRLSTSRGSPGLTGRSELYPIALYYVSQFPLALIIYGAGRNTGGVVRTSSADVELCVQARAAPTGVDVYRGQCGQAGAPYNTSHACARTLKGVRNRLSFRGC